MKRFVIIPDSFKGTLSSIQVCDILEKEIKKKFSQAEIIKIPVADGGEGSVDAFLQAGNGEKVYTEVSGPYFEKMTSFYGLIDGGKTAVIEMAACAGLPLVDNRKNPSKTTTYGFGELILHAIDQGVHKIILGLGGSATNDGGTGFATALGVQFFDQQNKIFIPVGGTLSQITKIDVSQMDKRLKNIDFVTMCDIDNPLFGLEGAAYIFSPQKGADQNMVEFLDHNLKDFANVVEKELGFNDPFFKGAGAAGGLGYGTKVFLNSKIQMGIETVLDVMHFNKLAKDVDYVITGEGNLDSQSLRGKVVIGVARRAKRLKTKVIAVVGQVTGDIKPYLAEGIDSIVITNYLNLSFEEVKKRAELDMVYTFQEFLKQID